MGMSGAAGSQLLAHADGVPALAAIAPLALPESDVATRAVFAAWDELLPPPPADSGRAATVEPAKAAVSDELLELISGGL